MATTNIPLTILPCAVGGYQRYLHSPLSYMGCQIVRLFGPDPRYRLDLDPHLMRVLNHTTLTRCIFLARVIQSPLPQSSSLHAVWLRMSCSGNLITFALFPHSCEGGLQNMLAAFCQPTFALLHDNSRGDPYITHADVVEDFFRLMV